MSTPLRVIFAGTPEFAAEHLDGLLSAGHLVCAVLTQPDRRAGRGKRLQPSPVKARALAAGLPVLQPDSLGSSDIQSQLAALEADVMVVVAYGLLLPQAVLDIPRHGCLNVHASLLPRWRGAAPIQRAIEAGDAESGITIMQMTAGLDTGPMLRQLRWSLDAHETAGTLQARMAEAGPLALQSVLASLPEQLANAQPQNDGLATYASKIKKTECQLDWQRDAQTLCRQIRAFNPAPVCFSFLDGERIKFWQAEEADTPEPQPPGTILAATDEGITVACGAGALQVTQLQFPGARPLPCAEIMRGRSSALAPGQRFAGLDPNP